MSAMLFHSAVKATVLNQATPSYVVERDLSFHSACSDGEVNKTEIDKNLQFVIIKGEATFGINGDQLFTGGTVDLYDATSLSLS